MVEVSLARAVPRLARFDTGNFVNRDRACLMGEAVGPDRPRPAVKAELRCISKAMIASLPLYQHTR